MAQWRLDQRHVTAPVAGIDRRRARPAGRNPPGRQPGGVAVATREHLRALLRARADARRRPSSATRSRSSATIARPTSTATISFIAPQAEYTPPVIYSEASRAKLVYLVEARPPPQQAALINPGQPVTVRPIVARRAEAAMTDFVIDVHDLRKSFGARKVVDGLTLQVAQAARSAAFSAPTAAARPPRSACCAACSSPTAAAAPASATTSSARRRRSAGRSAT